MKDLRTKEMITKCCECGKVKECIELLKGFSTCNECEDETFENIDKKSKVIKLRSIVD